jgi:hypothetical protein
VSAFTKEVDKVKSAERELHRVFAARMNASGAVRDLDQAKAELAQVVVDSDPTYTREDLIRVVVGQQWAVAIALHSSIYGAKRIAGHAQEWRVGGLPCAVDVVDGVG